jgi:hypothetical protein
MHCTDPLDLIAERNGIGRGALTRHAKAEGWQRKVKTIQRPRRTKAELAEAAAESMRQALSKGLGARLYLAIDRKVQEIEMRMRQTENEGRGAADAERDARTLSALARVYAKLVELDGAAKSAEKRETESKPSPARRSEDADELRRDLARRLERLDHDGDA